MPRQGDVVLVDLLDPNGRNPKRRPAVVITANRDISSSGNIVVAAISTQFDPVKLPPHYIRIVPSTVTGLHKDSVVKCKWLKIVKCSNTSVIGSLQTKHVIQIIQQVANLASN